jgi:hypothetical protein
VNATGRTGEELAQEIVLSLHLSHH